MKSRVFLGVIGLAIGLSGCGQDGDQTQAPSADPASSAREQTATSPTQADFSIDYVKYELENGLDVVLHQDRSDPVVAIDLAAHVGSARELPGRTGFAHLFEHLLFLDSENLGYGGLDEMNTRIGGEGTNGFTTHDMTQYFQAVPADALEKVVWAEADKLGWFIKTVTQPVLDNEKQVVKNEKRQRVDNQPYGHNFYVINKALYPEDHPYNWQVIGSLDDLDAATLQDVRDFYARWYVPNNVTVTISGDFEIDEAKAYVEKYFGEIPRGDEVAPLEPRAAVLGETKSLYHEDNFATVPQLTLVWPAVEEFHPDSYALNILTTYLTDGKKAPLNEVLIDEEQVTSNVSSFLYGKELAGEVYITMQTNPGEDIDGLMPALARGFDRFEENGISAEDLDRIKAGLEVGFYQGLQSALGKAIELGEYNLFTGDPGFIKTDLERLLAVAPEDVMRVYETYIKDKPHVATSFVPKGKPDLALEGAVKADIVEEPIVQGAEEEIDFDPTARTFEPTPSRFDRSVEPDFGKPYALPQPEIWRADLANGIGLTGIRNSETPLVYFSLAIDAGRERGDAAKPAVPAMTADLLTKGTANRTVAELEDAIKSLGSSISVSAGATSTVVSGSTLARNFDETIALVEEILLEPRWDEAEFALLKRKRLSELERAKGNPNYIAQREDLKLRYPEDHMFRYTSYGSPERLEMVSLDDLKAFYAETYKPGNAKLRIAGDIAPGAVATAFAGLAERWTGDALAPISLPLPQEVESATIYFYDVPGAKQSIIRIGRPSLSAVDPDYPLANAVNFLLGDIYTSRLNTALRVEKGYTYGIGSGFSGGEDRGTFGIRTSVRSNVTKESIALIRDIVSGYGPGFTENDLAIMKGALLRGQALATETLSAKLGVVSAISTYGYPDDYLRRNAERIDAMTLGQFKSLADQYMPIDAMRYLVVGDAQTQAARLADLGLGEPVMLAPVD